MTILQAFLFKILFKFANARILFIIITTEPTIIFLTGNVP